MSKRQLIPSKVFKKGTIVEVKGDQVAGGSAYALYWFRGKVVQVKKGRKVTYNIKMEDPTRFGQKKLIVKNLEARYVRSGEAQKKKTIGKGKKREKKKATAYTAAGAEGSVCESWEQTLARERAEQEALGIVPDAPEESKIPEAAEVMGEIKEEDDELDGLDEKYRKGVDIRKKIEAIRTEEFHLLDRKTLKYGDALFKKGDEVKYRDQIYELKRIRMYKERPVLMLENRRDGLRRAEVKDCVVERSIDDINAEKEAAKNLKFQRELDDEKAQLSLGNSTPAYEEELNIDDAPVGGPNTQKVVDDVKEELNIDDAPDEDVQKLDEGVGDVKEETSLDLIVKASTNEEDNPQELD